MSALPFAHLNLVRNPFGELDPDERARLAVVDAEDLARHLRPGRAIQLVGRCGRGKTTHLLALGRALPGACYVRARRDALPSASEALLLDEADALWPWQRWRALRGARAVAVATHVDLSAELRLAGFAVHTVDVAASPRTLHDAFARRIEHVRRGPGPVPRISTELVSALVARFGDDVREMEHHLYQRFQALSAVEELRA